MRHKDGFTIKVQHQGKVLQEYDAVANSEAPATNAGGNILHEGDYTARRSQFYVMPDKSGLDSRMTIKFCLAPNFDFQGGNLLQVTIHIKGTATREPVRSQLIWEHKVPVGDEPDGEWWFHWTVSMPKERNLKDSKHVADVVSMVIELECGVSDPRWDNNSTKALEAFERVPGGDYVVAILCRPSGSRMPQESNVGALSFKERSTNDKSIRASPAKRGVKRKRAEPVKKASGNAGASATKGESSIHGQDKQPIFGTSDDDTSKTMSLPDATRSAPLLSPVQGKTRASYFTTPELPANPSIMPTTPTADSTSQQTNKIEPSRSSLVTQPKDTRVESRPIKREEPGVIDLTQKPDEEEEIHHQIMDKELELEQKRLEREEIQARKELNALHRTRLRLGRTPSSPLGHTGASSPIRGMSLD